MLNIIKFRFRYTYICIGVIVVLFLSVCIGIYAYSNFEIRNELEKFDLTLADPEKKHSDRLLLYWLYAKYEPVFAIPEVDLSMMETGINMLDAHLHSVTRSYGDQERQTITSTLYPIEFLHEITKLEEVRRSFADSPDPKKANEYHSQLQVTARSYTDALSSLSHTLSTLENKTIGFPTGTTSTKVIASKLSSIRINVEDMLALEEKRFECLHNRKFVSCIDLHNTASNAKSQNTQPAAAPAMISQEMLDFKDIIDTLYTSYTASSTLIALTNSHCYPYERPVIYSFWGELNPHLPGVPFLRATPINDLFLHDIRTSSLTNLHYKFLLDAGLEYSVQIMNPYLCVDSGLEYQKLATIKKIYELASTIHFQNRNLPDDFDDLVKLHAYISGVNTVQEEAAVERYTSVLDNIFTAYTQKELVGYFDPQTYETLRRIELLWQTKSAQLDLFVNTAVFLTQGNSEIFDHIDVPLNELYLTRSYISLLFLLGNNTIAIGDTTLISKRQAFSLDSFIMFSARELYPTAEDKEVLKQMLTENKRKVP